MELGLGSNHPHSRSWNSYLAQPAVKHGSEGRERERKGMNDLVLVLVLGWS